MLTFSKIEGREDVQHAIVDFENAAHCQDCPNAAQLHDYGCSKGGRIKPHMGGYPYHFLMVFEDGTHLPDLPVGRLSKHEKAILGQTSFALTAWAEERNYTFPNLAKADLMVTTNPMCMKIINFRNLLRGSNIALNNMKAPQIKPPEAASALAKTQELKNTRYHTWALGVTLGQLLHSSAFFEDDKELIAGIPEDYQKIQKGLKQAKHTSSIACLVKHLLAWSPSVEERSSFYMHHHAFDICPPFRDVEHWRRDREALNHPTLGFPGNVDVDKLRPITSIQTNVSSSPAALISQTATGLDQPVTNGSNLSATTSSSTEAAEPGSSFTTTTTTTTVDQYQEDKNQKGDNGTAVEKDHIQTNNETENQEDDAVDNEAEEMDAEATAAEERESKKCKRDQELYEDAERRGQLHGLRLTPSRTVSYAEQNTAADGDHYTIHK